MDDLSNFILNLSDYYWHENDLSNFTVALCNSNRSFREIFIGYFFPDLNIDEIEDIVREVPDVTNGDSRVDIFIRLKDDENPYIIEVKISDKSHHFGQYEKAYQISKERLGYIVNYNMHQDGYDVKTWTDFYKVLKQKLESGGLDYKELIEGYLTYLEKVCKIDNFVKPMNLSGLYTLYEFCNIASEALKISKDSYSCAPYKQCQAVQGGKILGINTIDFYITYTDKRKCQIYGWLALYYFEEKPKLYIAIPERHNGKSHPELYNSKFKEGNTYIEPYEGEDEAWGNNCLWFQYKDIADFDNKGIEEQKKCLNEFVNEVFDFVTVH